MKGGGGVRGGSSAAFIMSCVPADIRYVIVAFIFKHMKQRWAPMKIFDRYSLLCISVATIIAMAVLINEEEPEAEDIIGAVYDIRSAQNGYTFSFDGGGETIRCFARTEPSEFGVYMVKGSFSDDGNMFFISSMRQIEQNEI